MVRAQSPFSLSSRRTTLSAWAGHLWAVMNRRHKGPGRTLSGSFSTTVKKTFRSYPAARTGVGATPGRNEPQVVIQKLIPEPDLNTRLPQRPALQARHPIRHADPPVPQSASVVPQPPGTGRGSPAYRCALREGAPVTDVYEFIDAEYATLVRHAPAITQMCAWLGVSKSGFYDWRSRPESATAKRQEKLRLLIRKIFDDSDGTRTGTGASLTQLARQGIVAGAGAGPQADAAAGPGGLPAAAVAAAPTTKQGPGRGRSRTW